MIAYCCSTQRLSRQVRRIRYSTLRYVCKQGHGCQAGRRPKTMRGKG
jgi:hypothetical protein